MTMISLLDLGGGALATLEVADEPSGVFYGVRWFARNADGQYVEATSVEQPVYLPVQRPLFGLGEVN